LLAALSLEVRPFLRRVQARPIKGLGLSAWEFSLLRGDAIEIKNSFNRKLKTENRKPFKGLALVTGMGPDAAARAAAVLKGLHPRMLVSLGFAGALTPELAPGDLVLGESIWDFHPDTGALDQIPSPLPPCPLAEAIRELTQAGLSAAAGSLVTTPFIINKRDLGEPLRRLNYPAVDLETGVWAAWAAAQGLPFLGLRAITDTAGEEIPDYIKKARGTVLEALGWLARDPARLRTLLHLWRRSRLAARRLAAALLVLLPFFEAASSQHPAARCQG
jgi:adenosylhomocysteine nucleosidase